MEKKEVGCVDVAVEQILDFEPSLKFVAKRNTVKYVSYYVTYV